MNSDIKTLVISDTLDDLFSLEVILKRVLLNCVDLSREIDFEIFCSNIIDFIQDIYIVREDLEEYGKK